MAWQPQILFHFLRCSKKNYDEGYGKNQLAEKYGFTLLRFWEDEIKNDFENVKQRIINALLATT
ncbi:DUF559 domain-containing protein [Lysinibacillus sp. FSL K6-0232]|uniref:DUF559 domain-containing protein n=1 Tax=Lysinibacillus sp. FSL K6-0232 TaxID=2921425 RepID=UPI004040A2E8